MLTFVRSSTDLIYTNPVSLLEYALGYMMPEYQPMRLFLSGIYLSVTIFSLAACDTQTETSENKPMLTSAAEAKTPGQGEISNTTEPEIENKSYLFDVSDHSIDELEALLARAEEVSQTHPADFEDLEIVMVIHGPDIDWFTQQNYEHHQPLVDLAARLDATNVIDMKVCERTIQDRGIAKDDLPAFIESVPYAPLEIKQRLEDGFINL